MNKGIEILLARMESNPDEFTTGNKSGKWQHLMEQYEDYMEPEDRKALMDKYNSLKMQKFTEKVMKELLQEEQGDGVALASASHPTHSGSGQTPAQYTAALAQSMAQTKHTVAANILQNAYANTSTISLNNSNDISTSIQLGKQTLTERTLKKLKALIK